MLKKYSCITCSKLIEAYTERIYCSTKCQNDKKYKDFISNWKKGIVEGMRGKTSTSGHIRRYLFEKYNNGCSECGWSKTNQYTGKIPLELEHIDGNYKNNEEKNLKLLCSNCHSLTATWKGANKKEGRPRSKYYRGT